MGRWCGRDDDPRNKIKNNFRHMLNGHKLRGFLSRNLKSIGAPRRGGASNKKNKDRVELGVPTGSESGAP